MREATATLLDLMRCQSLSTFSFRISFEQLFFSLFSRIYHIEDEYTENLEAFVADAPSKIVRRQREQATMFGMPKWKPQIRKKELNERSSGVRGMAPSQTSSVFMVTVLCSAEILEGEDTLPKPEIIAEAAESQVLFHFLFCPSFTLTLLHFSFQFLSDH